MSAIYSFWSLFLEHVYPTVINVALMATVLLVAALASVAILKQLGASAACRCQVWIGAVTCLICLPFAIQMFPNWGFPNEENAGDEVAILPRQTSDEPTFPVETNTRDATTQVTETASTGSPLLPDPIPVQHANEIRWTSEVLAWLPTIWLTGFVAILGTTLMGWLSLLHLRLTSRNTNDMQLLDELNGLKNQLGIRRNVRLVLSNRRGIPMTWGMSCPTILLPKSAAGWSSEVRRAVLLHELAHIRRFDYSMQLVSRLVVAMYWYNPLVWFAFSKLRGDQEASCDDVVLNHGTRAPRYAEHLIQVLAEGGNRRWRSAIALGAVRTGRLEQRVIDILNTNQNRRSPSMRQTILSGVLILVTGLVIATAGPLKLLSADDKNRSTVDSAIDEKGAAKSLADIRETVLKNFVRELDRESVTRSAIDGMLASLDDPYSQYISAKELANLRISVQGELSGIGARLDKKDEFTVITLPLPGSPALAANLKPGDVILEIDSASAKSLELIDVARLIRGPIGSVVALKIRRGKETMEIKVTRDKIKLSTVRGFTALQSPADKTGKFMIDSVNGIGYVHVSSLTNNTPDELRGILEKLKGQGLKGVILDLRFCPGGTIDAAVGVVSQFVQTGDVVIIRGRDGKENAIRVKADTYLGDFPLVVIVNEQTASAGEIVAGALQDHGRAKIVGTRSFGKASVQTLLPLSDELGAIKLTTAFYCTPTGRNIDRRPGKSTWGVNADDGFFVPLPTEQRKALQKQMAIAHPIREKKVDAITPKALREKAADPQLAAALKTMQAKLQSGEFAKVGGSRSDLEKYLRRSEVQSRHAQLLDTLNQLQKIANEAK